jgi:hypothetical protein
MTNSFENRGTLVSGHKGILNEIEERESYYNL